MKTINVAELNQKLKNGEKLHLVDVRETFEWDICRIDGAQLMPLSSFDPSTSGLDPEATIYLYCYKGKRSMLALKELKRTGFNKLKNLSGGIDLWAEEVDSEMPQY